jgi:RimJ/RimL family protein N-acetyltransferase
MLAGRGMKRFVEPDFPVPGGLETEEFRLRMLSVHDVVKDFDAVMASAPFLRKLFPGWGGWPEGLTLEQNLIDLGWHQKEFQRRRSFAYTVVAPDESRVVGCVYVVPSQREGYDAEVYFWARESAQGDAADSALAAAVMPWIESEWPFQRVAYPGRAIDWASWDKVALKA